MGMWRCLLTIDVVCVGRDAPGAGNASDGFPCVHRSFNRRRMAMRGSVNEQAQTRIAMALMSGEDISGDLLEAGGRCATGLSGRAE